MTTKTREVARLVSNATGRGHSIFNDKMVDGTRSLKVWGWRKEDYEQAARMLDLLGCKVKMVVTPYYKDRHTWGGGNNVGGKTRLHVTE